MSLEYIFSLYGRHRLLKYSLMVILIDSCFPENIRIKFYELDESGNEIWCDYGKFSELDVHHQYAIVFR